MNGHAYSHLVGKIVGIRTDQGIVQAVITRPEIGQDDSIVLVVTEDFTWHYVPYMSTYRADFIDAKIS